MEDLFRILVCAVLENSGVQIEVPQAQKELPELEEMKKSQVKSISIPKSVKKLGGKLLKKYELCTELDAKEKKKYDSLLLSVENNILILLQSLIEGRMLAQEDVQAD